MECLGFLPGSACPHYDGEERRRPRYSELVATGLPAGLAADDGVALHYVGTELREIVTCPPGTAAYRVTRDGEERLETRELERLVAQAVEHAAQLRALRAERAVHRGELLRAERRQREMHDAPVVRATVCARRGRPARARCTSSVTALWVSDSVLTRSETVVVPPAAPAICSSSRCWRGVIPTAREQSSLRRRKRLSSARNAAATRSESAIR